MPRKAKIIPAVLACAVLTACQGSGGGSGTAAPGTGGPAPTGVQQCQAVTATAAPVALPATPRSGPTGGSVAASLILVPSGTHSLGVYLRDPWTGALVDRGYVPTGPGPDAVAVSAGRYVYVADSQSGTISAYAWQAATNGLVPLNTSNNSIASGPGTASLAVIGTTLYALNTGNDTISAFTIGANGTLTLASNTAAATGLTSLVAGPNVLYGLGTDAITSYSPGTTPTATSTTALAGIIAAATNSGGNLYVLTSSEVTAFNPGPGGGLSVQDSAPLPAGFTATALAANDSQVNVAGQGPGATELVTFPLISGGIACPASAVLGTSGQPGGVLISPEGHFVYVTDATRADLLAYTATTAQSGPALIASVRTRPTPHGAGALVADVTVLAQRLYVVEQSNSTIAGYDVGANGALSGPSTSNTTCGTASCSNTAETGPSVGGIAPDGQHFYASDWAGAGYGDLTAFSLNSQGVLGAPQSTAAGQSPMGLAIDPSNRYLYVANSCYQNASGTNCSGTISSYSLNAGIPQPLAIDAAGTGLYPMLLTIDPTGQYLYVSQFAANSVGEYTINQDSGALSPGPSSATGSAPWGVVVGPSGRHLYVSDTGSASGNSAGVSIFRIAATTGGLTPASTPSLMVGGNPLGIAIGPKGRRLYVATQYGAGNGAGTVEVFTRPAPLAAHAVWNATPITLSTPVPFAHAYGLAISHNGKALYVIDNGSASGGAGVQALAIPPFGQGQNPAAYTFLGNEPTAPNAVQGIAAGGLD